MQHELTHGISDERACAPGTSWSIQDRHLSRVFHQGPRRIVAQVPQISAYHMPRKLHAYGTTTPAASAPGSALPGRGRRPDISCSARLMQLNAPVRRGQGKLISMFKPGRRHHTSAWVPGLLDELLAWSYVALTKVSIGTHEMSSAHVKRDLTAFYLPAAWLFDGCRDKCQAAPWPCWWPCVP